MFSTNDTRSKEILRLKVKGWKKISHANNNQKKAGVAILIPDKTDLRSKLLLHTKKGTV